MQTLQTVKFHSLFIISLAECLQNMAGESTSLGLLAGRKSNA